MNNHNEELKENKNTQEDRRASKEMLPFDVQVYPNDAQLVFNIIRNIDGHRIHSAFSIDRSMFIEKNIIYVAGSLNMMFESSILRIANKIRRGLNSGL